MGLFSVHFLTAQVVGAFRRLINSGQQIKDGGFTGTVRADQANQLAFADLKAEIIYGLQASKGNAKMLCFQYRFFTHGLHLPFSFP